MIDSEEVRARLIELRDRIDRVERSWNHRVAVVGVTKGFGADAVAAAVAAGCDAIGENYAQELLDKRAAIERLGPEVHFIGRLQRNKVRHLAGIVDVWCSLDRASVIDEVAKRAPGSRVLIQVDTTGDPGKGGCDVSETASLVDRATEQGLDVRGLMTVGPTAADSEAARPGFRQVRALVDRLGLDECSMGMSGDLVVAVEEGSTEVRVGTALFGPRPPRPAQVS
jgi:pyridoxal phosphate enzyme (YggS family)